MKLSQNERIAEILRRDGQIDNYFCLRTRLTNRLAARIYDLRRKYGWEFSVREDETGNAIYTVVKEPNLTLFS